MKVYIAGLTNGLVNIVDGKTGLQMRATTASREAARQLNKAIVSRKFNRDQAAVRQMPRTLPDGTVINSWGLFYQGKLALWLEGDNGKLDPSYEEELFKLIKRRALKASSKQDLIKLWRDLARTYGGSKKGKILGFRPQFNDRVVQLLRKRSQQLQSQLSGILADIPSM